MFKWREGQQEAIHHTKIKRAITSSFARALKVLQQKHLQCKEEEFVYSNDGSNNLCSSLESAFLHGLKDSVAHKLTAYVGLTAAPDQTTSMNFWSVVLKFTHGDVVTQLQRLTQITTEIGLCRAWVRLALNDGLMESYLHSMIVDTKTLKYFYHSHSYMRDHEQPGILKNYLTGLMSLEFKLSYNSSVLNQWSNTTLQLTGALDPHTTPAPTIVQAGMGSAGTSSAGADARLQTNSQGNNTKVDEASAATTNVQIASDGESSLVAGGDLQKTSVNKSGPTSLVAGSDLQNASVNKSGPTSLVAGSVEDLQKASANKTDHAASPSLPVLEGSPNSGVPCPGPAVGASSEVKVAQKETEHDIDSLGETVRSLALPGFPEHSREQDSLASAESLNLDRTESCLLSDDQTKTAGQSNVVLVEATLLNPAASPSRPRSRRVGEDDESRPQSRRVGEDDLKHVSSRSLSPPSISPGKASPHYSEDTSHTPPTLLHSAHTPATLLHSGHTPPTLLHSAHTPPTLLHSGHTPPNVIPGNTFLHSAVSWTLDPAQERSGELSRSAEDSLVFQSIYHGAEESLESQDKSLTSLHNETSHKCDQKELMRKTFNNESDEADQHRQERCTQEAHSFSDAIDHLTQLADRYPEQSLDPPQEQSLRAEPSSSPQHGSESSLRSFLVPSTKDREPHPADEGGSLFLTRDGHDHHDSDELVHSEKKRPTSHHHKKREHDPQTAGHREVASGRARHSSKPPSQDSDLEEATEAEKEMSISPSRFGNSLSSMSGWSSEIESKRDRRKQSAAERNRGESFATMLRGYTPAPSQQAHSVTLNDVIDALPCDSDDGSSLEGSELSDDVSDTQEVQLEDTGADNFEVLKSPSEFFCGLVEANSSRMYFLYHVPCEHGLSHQNFACKGCTRPIGIIYGPPRLCEFDGGLYCFGCHENNETYIPSSILYDWDFRKKKVSQDNYKFLQELEEQALYNVEELNPKLYNHVPELQDLKTLRQQLVYLKSYLFACSQKVAESMRQKVWPREHLYDSRDLFSVMDFLQVQSGSLQRLLKDIVRFSSQHVYDCNLCSLKGFVCEICRNAQVIYPFEVDTTIRCTTCKAVYHKTCMTESLPCPKCERWGRHASSSNIIDCHPEDYGMSPHA